MTDQTDLAALLHADLTTSGMASCVHSLEGDFEPWCEEMAARLIAAGVRVTGEADCGEPVAVQWWVDHAGVKECRGCHWRWKPDSEPEHDLGCVVDEFLAAGLVAAFAAVRGGVRVGDAGLEVERLARALHTHGCIPEVCAPLIAREYAALAGEEKP